MQQILLLSLVAVVDPVIAGAAAVMLLLPEPKRLMLGFVLGALLTSITLGFVIVFALEGTNSTTSTTKRTVDPVVDTAAGVGFLLIATLVATGVWSRIAERRRERKGPRKGKGPSRLQRELSKGSPRLTFCAGAVYEAMPSVVYLAVMHDIVKLNASTLVSVFLVVLICVAQLALVLVPLISFAVAPTWTPKALEEAKTWFSRNDRKIAVVALTIVGAWLLGRGVVTLLR
jgi:Sap, sulfolipid-1-addressing protein